MLIEGRKFDIRMWVLLNHNQDLFIYKEGYLRTSSEKYPLSNTNDNNNNNDDSNNDDNNDNNDDVDVDIDNPFIHLTNNAIQKKNPNYHKYEPSNMLSFSQFYSHLHSTKNWSQLDFQ